jgi:hypothetical protein
MIAVVMSMTVIVAAESENHAAIVYANGFEQYEVAVCGNQRI